MPLKEFFHTGNKSSLLSFRSFDLVLKHLIFDGQIYGVGARVLFPLNIFSASFLLFTNPNSRIPLESGIFKFAGNLELPPSFDLGFQNCHFNIINHDMQFVFHFT